MGTQLEGKGGAGKRQERGPETLDSRWDWEVGGRSQLEQGGPRGVCRVKNEMQGRSEQFSSGE